MPEYIEREAAIATVCKGCNKEFPNDPCEPAECYIQQGLFKLPAADVAEVRHGEWNIRSEIYKMLDDVDEELFVECPFCQRRYHVPFEFEDEKILEYAREEYPYCNCGAKMDGKGDV